MVNQRLVAEGKPPIDLRPVPEVLTDEDILEMVHAGTFPATIVDQYKARLWARVLPGLVMHPDAFVSDDGTLAWAFRKGSPELETSVNAFLRTHRQGTLFGNILIRRYTQGTRFITPVRTGAAQQNFDRMVVLFTRYSEKYEMSTAMMMALAYQESGLNQAAVSPVGAIGVMQVMPPTGRQMNVGDIRQLEPNIHAGIKYMHHLDGGLFPDRAAGHGEPHRCSPSRPTMPAPTACGGCVVRPRIAAWIPMSGSTTSRSWRQRPSVARR